MDELIKDLKYPLEEKELRFKINAEDFQDYGDQVLDSLKEFVAKQPNMEPAKDNYEGYRVCFDHGWFLLRKSLHDPILPCNIESTKEGGCKEIANMMYPFMVQFEKLDLASLRQFIE